MLGDWQQEGPELGVLGDRPLTSSFSLLHFSTASSSLWQPEKLSTSGLPSCLQNDILVTKRVMVTKRGYTDWWPKGLRCRDRWPKGLYWLVTKRVTLTGDQKGYTDQWPKWVILTGDQKGYNDRWPKGLHWPVTKRGYTDQWPKELNWPAQWN